MNIRVLSSSYFGIESYLVEVEIDISNGIPSFSIIGLGDTAISESKDRIKTALKNSGYKLEPRKIIVNLSPAGIKKEGAHFDLPIAIGIMVAMGYIKDRENICDKYIFLGELSLSGEIKSVKGVINSSIFAKENNYCGVVVPYENYEEASLIKGIDIVPVRNLDDVVKFILENQRQGLKIEKNDEEDEYMVDFSEVKGQSMAKRGMEISASGKHNIIMIGSPGSGKSMLSKRLPTILPKLKENEIIETTKIYSIAGELNDKNPIIKIPPFRAPHHTSTPTSIIGGGKKITPGEICLATNGVLFLDELAEFPRSVLESLRQPLEDKMVSIARTQYKVEFKTDFLFLATSNPCSCGYYYEGERCKCTQSEVNRYMKKLSGPIMDRIDIHLQIKRLSDDELINDTKEETSEIIRKRVEKTREIQYKRFGTNRCNGDMTQKEIEKFCVLSEEDKKYLKKIVQSFEISARGYYKILKVARTIADMERCENIKREHLMEALSYRRRE